MRKNVGIIGLLIILSAIVGYGAYSRTIPKKEASLEESATFSQSIEAIHAEQGKPVKVAAVMQKAITISKTFYGTMAPYAEAKVQGKYGGKLVLLKAKEGDPVTAGETIVRFDESDARLQLQQAIAAKNAAIQGKVQAESTLQLAQTDLHRYQQLLKDGFVSKQTIDSLRNQVQLAQATLQSAREKITTAEAQIRLLENTLKDLKIAAPISGVVDEKYFNLNEIAKANAEIYHIVDLDRLYAEVEIPELYISRIDEQMDVEINVDSLKGQTFSGTVDRIVPTGNPQSRQFTAKVLVVNPEHAIKPGMFARVSIGLEQIPDAFVLNTKAIVKDENQYHVFKVVGDHVEKVVISIIQQGREQSSVLSDRLIPQDRVVIEGARLLQDNDHIKILSL